MAQLWNCLEERLMLSTRVFDVRVRRFRRQGDGVEGDFYSLTCSDWVQALAVTPDEKLVLVSQYRFGSKDFFWEIPGGIMDPGENPIQAAVRELKEETGYEGQKPRLLATISPNPAILNNHSHIVLVDQAMPVQNPSWDEHEEMDVQLVPLTQVWSWIKEGKIRHACVLSALFHLKLALE